MKKILSVLLAAMLVLVAGCGQVEEVAPNAAELNEPGDMVATGGIEDTTLGIDKDIIVLYVNDVHCGIDDNLGYQDLVTVKNAYEAMGYSVLLVDCGDAIQGDIVGTLSKGSAIIDIMNEAGFDVAVPGNHEFDYGMERFLELSNRANFDYVSCNFVDKNGEAVFAPYVIKEVDGVKIAFVGVCTPKTLVTSTPAYFMDDNGEFIYSFEQDETGEKLYECVQNAVNKCYDEEGAAIVVALCHLGTEDDCSPWTSTELIENTTGINVVLDGHSHSVWEEEHVKDKNGDGEAILSSTGTKLKNIGVLRISNDWSVHTTLVNDKVSDVATMQDIIEMVKEQNEELVNTVVAHTDVDLVINDPETEERIVRVSETNLGDLCADAYRAMSGADIAFVNGGGVRSDIKAGDITYGDIIKVHPFGNNMCMVEATGSEIYDALEMSASALPAELGGFLQVSGISFTIDVNVPSPVVVDENKMFVKVDGEPRVKDIMVGDEPLDLEGTYTVACHDYLLKNMGDGYTMFADNTLLLDSVMIDNQVLINYIVEKLDGTVGEEYSDPYGQGRITIVD